MGQERRLRGQKRLQWIGLGAHITAVGDRGPSLGSEAEYMDGHYWFTLGAQQADIHG